MLIYVPRMIRVIVLRANVIWSLFSLKLFNGTSLPSRLQKPDSSSGISVLPIKCQPHLRGTPVCGSLELLKNEGWNIQNPNFLR